MAFQGTNFKVKTIAKRKGQRKRAERKVIQSVRAQCVARDGYCRIGTWYRNGDNRIGMFPDDVTCDGPSEWMHLWGHKRSRTRKQAPERRHNRRYAMIGCRKHHRLEEAGRLQIIEYLAMGCDGPLRFVSILLDK